VEAFRQMPEKTLLIAGHIYPKFEHVVDTAPPNVKFLGTCEEPRLIDLYSRCEGFITTAIDEDFGITPVEAMASGKPVVATKEGGYLETVADGYSGILTSPDVKSLCNAVRQVSANPVAFTDECLKRARLFDYSAFKATASEYLDSCIKE
jgi:glycosyltransferase involved in cell wall biosynthesis